MHIFLYFTFRQTIQDDLAKEAFTSQQKWTTILINAKKQYDPDRFFNATWSEYQKGISVVYINEYLMSLDQLHELTAYESPHELMIILKDWSGETRYAKYDLFQIGSAAEKYALKVLGEYSGDAGDSLRPHVGHKFSTYDQDNDDNDELNCAAIYGGGWWFYGNCTMRYFSEPQQKIVCKG